MPATAVTRPPAMAGPRLRNFSCAKTSLGLSAAPVLAAVFAKPTVATQLRDSRTAAAVLTRECRVIYRLHRRAGAPSLEALCIGKRTVLRRRPRRNHPTASPSGKRQLVALR